MRKLTGVLIGCGAIAREHLAALNQMPNVVVGGVCDLSPARAEATAERFGIARWYSDFETMLSETTPSLVHITTPPSSHFPIAKTCLNAGLNVLCEKPITREYEEFHELKVLAQEKGCFFIENQNLRYHSSIRRMIEYINSDALGDLLDIQIAFALDLLGPGSPYTDENAPHFGASLRGGIIGDFLPHIAYLAHMFAGPVSTVRTVWSKRGSSPLVSVDEFRGYLKGERSTAQVSFSANSKVTGYWVRLAGTKMYVEANLLEPPRIVTRRYRPGEQAVATLVDGLSEARSVMTGSIAALGRKLGGTSSYDGLPEMISKIYEALENQEPQPISLNEIDSVVRLLDAFTNPANAL